MALARTLGARLALRRVCFGFLKRESQSMQFNYRSAVLPATLLACLGTSGVAVAQSTETAPSSEPPSEVTPAPDSPEARTMRTDPPKGDPTPSAPATSIPQSDEPHPDVVVRTWPNRPMLITGVVVLGGMYGASAIVAATSDRKADDKLFLPVVGPWLDLKNRDCEVNECGNDTFNKVLLVSDGAIQGIGAVTLLLSLVIPESSRKPWYLIGDEKLSVTPQVGTGVTGLRAVGAF
jgi:hypothetical protein